MDDEPMWDSDRVVALTLGSVITILETANEFAIKDTENEAVYLMMFPLSLTGEAKTWLGELNEGTIKTWDELRTTFISRFFPPAIFELLLREIRVFSQHENKSLTDAWLRMKEMLRNCHGHNLSKGNIIKIFYHADLGASINLMPYSLYAKLSLETLKPTKISIRLADRPSQYPIGIAENMLLKLDYGEWMCELWRLSKEQQQQQEVINNSDTDKIIARMDAMTLKMDARYKELQSNAKKAKSDLNEDDIPISREEEAKFMQTFFFSVSVTKLTTGRLVNGSSCSGIDMVIKDLDLEPKVDAMMREFLEPSQWNELSKETSSKILPCGVDLAGRRSTQLLA
nr:hypothetical protein [Tanacetum cinerariifolium]